MKLIEKLLGRDNEVFELLDASVSQAQRSILILADILRMPYQTSMVSELVQAKHKNKDIVNNINELLCKMPVTPLELEDIDVLSVAFYRISKNVAKFGTTFVACREHIKEVSLSPQMDILEQAIGTIVQMITSLRKHLNLEILKDLNEHLHDLEREADGLMSELTSELYNSKHEPLKIIIMLDLYERLEGIIDHCRDAGNSIFQIVLKNT